MKKLFVLLSVLAFALALCACNQQTIYEQYATIIAKEVGATEYQYTYEPLLPKEQSYLYTFIASKPVVSYSLWVCKGSGGQIDCNCLSFNYVY